MKTSQRCKRRAFMSNATGLFGLSALMQGGILTGMGAAAPSPLAPAKKEAVEKVLASLEAKPKDFLNVARKDGEFLRLLVKAARAKRVLEVGTSHGYSGLWLALGLEENEGRLTTIEIRPERMKLAKENFAQAGLAERVTFLQGDAHKLVPTLEASFDLVFLDADKDGTVDYFNKLFPAKLVPGGLLLVHNAIQRRDAMKDFLELIAKHPNFDSVILSLTMDDGFSVSYRQRG